MNGNDFLEIEEAHIQEITEKYVAEILEGTEEVPEEYRYKWVEGYLQGYNEPDEDLIMDTKRGL